MLQKAKIMVSELFFESKIVCCLFVFLTRSQFSQNIVYSSASLSSHCLDFASISNIGSMWSCRPGVLINLSIYQAYSSRFREDDTLPSSVLEPLGSTGYLIDRSAFHWASCGPVSGCLGRIFGQTFGSCSRCEPKVGHRTVTRYTWFLKRHQVPDALKTLRSLRI